MRLKLYREPELNKPDLICGWPGIGRIGIMAADYLRRSVAAEELGEIEPWGFFEPNKVIFQDGLLKNLEFPTNKFYFHRLEGKDLLFFIGEQQPVEKGSLYATGEKAYKLANLVLDMAEKFGCQRVYTSGAAVTQTHHTLKPGVWAVPNCSELIDEIRGYENTALMSDIGESQGQGSISGLNGLLLGVARKRNLKALCLMGEIPHYLQASPWAYPKGAISVLEVMAQILRIDIDMIPLLELARKIDASIESFLNGLWESETIPPQIKDEIRGNIERMKHIGKRPGPITNEDQKRIMEHIDEFFKKGDKGNEATG